MPGCGFFSIAPHLRVRAGEFAQGRQRGFRAGFLDNDHHDIEHGETEQNQRFGKTAQEQIDEPRREQQLQHRLAHRIPRDTRQMAALVLREFIRSILAQARLGLRRCQTIWPCGSAGGA